MCDACDNVDRRRRFESALARTIHEPPPEPEPEPVPYDWAVDGW
jgi:hypothetical protein